MRLLKLVNMVLGAANLFILLVALQNAMEEMIDVNVSFTTSNSSRSIGFISFTTGNVYSPFSDTPISYWLGWSGYILLYPMIVPWLSVFPHLNKQLDKGSIDISKSLVATGESKEQIQAIWLWVKHPRILRGRKSLVNGSLFPHIWNKHRFQPPVLTNWEMVLKIRENGNSKLPFFNGHFSIDRS